MSPNLYSPASCAFLERAAASRASADRKPIGPMVSDRRVSRMPGTGVWPPQRGPCFLVRSPAADALRRLPEPVPVRAAQPGRPDHARPVRGQPTPAGAGRDLLPAREPGQFLRSPTPAGSGAVGESLCRSGSPGSGGSTPGPPAQAPALDGARWDAVAGAAAHELGLVWGRARRQQSGSQTASVAARAGGQTGASHRASGQGLRTSRLAPALGKGRCLYRRSLLWGRLPTAGAVGPGVLRLCAAAARAGSYYRRGRTARERGGSPRGGGAPSLGAVGPAPTHSPGAGSLGRSRGPQIGSGDQSQPGGTAGRTGQLALSAPMAGGTVFPLDQMHFGLPTLAGRESARGGPADLWR
jgi:hypothetical protein